MLRDPCWLVGRCMFWAHVWFVPLWLWLDLHAGIQNLFCLHMLQDVTSAGHLRYNKLLLSKVFQAFSNVLWNFENGLGFSDCLFHVDRAASRLKVLKLLLDAKVHRTYFCWFIGEHGNHENDVAPDISMVLSGSRNGLQSCFGPSSRSNTNQPANTMSADVTPQQS